MNQVSPQARWFYSFIKDHMKRCDKPGWPTLFPDRISDDASRFFASWILKFERYAVSRDVADDASILLSQGDYPFPGDGHLDALLEAVRQIRARRAAEKKTSGRSAQDPGVRVDLAITRADASHRARDCPECYGSGFASRERRLANDQTYRFSFYCRCVAGRWLRAHHENHPTEDQVHKRLRDLQGYPELWDPADYPGWQPEPTLREWAMEPGWISPVGGMTPDLATARPVAAMLRSIGGPVAGGDTDGV